ncbi:MAG: M48 family metallopeptidase [Myxococcota bacterium]
MRRTLRNPVIAAALTMGALGCTAVGQVASSVDSALYELVPTNPVTGLPMANLVSEQDEVAGARKTWTRLAAAQEGIAVDPPGPRLEQIRRVFGHLVAVAHRSDLPWEVHLIRAPTVNAATPGGGMVFVFEGIFTDGPGGQGFVSPGDDEVAAVLAHEISHVTLMHGAERTTHAIFLKKLRDDPYFSASYSTANEAEADKLSVLYLALAGYDPLAAPRIWQVALLKQGSNPGSYLYDHPLRADRIRLTFEAATRVRQYYRPGVRDPDWESHRANNPLFSHARKLQRQPGAGLLNATAAALELIAKQRAAKDEAHQRKKAAVQTQAYQAGLVRILQTRVDAQGRGLIWMQFQNASQLAVGGLGVTVHYRSRQGAIADDPSCGGQTNIPPGQTVWLTCQYHPVPGADRLQVELRAVTFRQ